MLNSTRLSHRFSQNYYHLCTVIWIVVLSCIVLYSGTQGGAAQTRAAAAVITDFPCTTMVPCEVQPTHYIAVPPKGWNGRDKLEVAVWLHGYGRTARIPARNKELMQIFSKHNLLFVAPSGLNKSWSVPGSPDEGRDDIAFVADVLADVAKRFPVSRNNTTVFGFSLGGSFVWTLACQRPEMFRHYVAFAGGFWLPHPTHCAEGPVDLVHIHGKRDSVVPLLGRPIGSRWYQGDVPRGLEFWRTSKACGELSQPFEAPAGLSCRAAKKCSAEAGSEVTSCRHDGGHLVNPKWVDWVLSRLTGKGG